MLDLVISTFIFFLPAYIGNMMPVIFDKFVILKSLAVPIDGGRKWRGKEIFGSHKTWRGIVAGVIGGFLTALGLAMIGFGKYATDFTALFGILFIAFVWGAGLGFGALMGDLIKSFFKRRLGIREGRPFVPFDQVDFALGAIVISFFMTGADFLFWQRSITFLIITPILHLSSNVIAYKLGWKKVWW